ncbi:MAG: tRNA lysidine(34) synthetase TilS, partial [Oscillospiraceae bacterium]|nr:tRNA lysidine(34) synthetase TilS [Oscillospiraceae bacterium]
MSVSSYGGGTKSSGVVKILKEAHPVLKNRAAAMILESFGFAFDFERTLRLAEKFGTEDFKEELSKNEYLVQKGGIVFKETKAKKTPEIVKTAFAAGEFEISPEKTAEVSVASYDEFKNSYKLKNLALKDTFDFDKIMGTAVFRSRTEGDKADIHGGTKTLKKLFIEEKIPAEERNSVAIIADDEGVLWVEGLGAARRARLSEKTVNVAVIKIRKK